MQSRREGMTGVVARLRRGLRPVQRAIEGLCSTDSKTGISGEKPCQVFSQLFCNFVSRNSRRSDSQVVAREPLPSRQYGRLSDGVAVGCWRWGAGRAVQAQILSRGTANPPFAWMDEAPRQRRLSCHTPRECRPVGTSLLSAVLSREHRTPVPAIGHASLDATAAT